MNASALATRALRGFLWNGSASLMQLGTFAVIYSLVDRSELGRFEWALTLMMLLAIIGDLGLGAALVQLRETSEEHFDTAFWTNAIWGSSLALGVFFSAPLLATFLGGEDPQAFVAVLRILCFLLPFASVSAVFRARLQRDLSFSSVAVSEVVSSLSFAVVVAALLWLRPELGVLVPVSASVCRELGLLASLGFSARWLPRWRWRGAALHELLRFALNFTGSRAVAYCNSKIAHAFVFLPLGPVAMAHYVIAERLTLMPLTRLATTINRVSFPAFSTIQDDDALLRKGYLQSVQSLMLSMGPVLAGVFVFAPEILSLVDMEPAATALRILALATFFKVVGTMVGSMFMAKGRTDWSFYWSLFSLAVLIPSMYFVGVPHGLKGVTGVIAATSMLFLALSQQLANRLIGLAFVDYLRHLAQPALVVLAAFVALFFARPFLLGPAWIVLLQGMVLGVLVTLFFLRLLAWDLCVAHWRRLRG